MDVLGAKAMQQPKAHSPLRGPWKLLSPNIALAMINGTPLGTVLTKQRFRCHRKCGGKYFAPKRQVDMFKYAAWLAHCRHDPERREDLLKMEANRKKRTMEVTTAQIIALLESQAYRCALTGTKLTPHTAMLDHMLPISRGGENSMENIQVLRSDINRTKGTLTNEEFVDICREVVAHADRRAVDFC